MNDDEEAWTPPWLRELAAAGYDLGRIADAARRREIGIALRRRKIELGNGRTLLAGAHCQIVAEPAAVACRLRDGIILRDLRRLDV